MAKFPLLNFANRRACIVHPRDSNQEMLSTQLGKLGLRVSTAWHDDRCNDNDFDVVFFDSDRGYDGQFTWPTGQASIPLIALLGSEAPGRIEWTTTQRPSAYLLKPVRSTGVFSALTIAFYTFEREQKLQRKIEALESRIRARPYVAGAIQLLSGELKLDHDEAYRLLRERAMVHRVSVELLCKEICAERSLAPLKGGGSCAGRQTK